MVTELKKEVERLRNIRECEQEIDWWSNSLPYLQERDWDDTPQVVIESLPCNSWVEGGDLSWVEGGDLRDEKEWI